MSDKSIYDRINANEFKNNKPYPTKGAVKDPDEYRRLSNEYREENARLKLELRRGLEEEFGDSRWPDELLYALYSLAWEEGHASGYHEVATHYSTFAELAQVAFNCGLAAAKKG